MVKSFLVLFMFVTSSSAIGGVADISVKELAKLINENQVSIFDANGDKTRQKYGVIPNAKMLSSYDEYSISKELPKNKSQKIVFYCANVKCSAAPKAAERAMAAGYKNVAHLSVGIMGWKKAGQKAKQYSGTN